MRSLRAARARSRGSAKPPAPWPRAGRAPRARRARSPRCSTRGAAPRSRRARSVRHAGARQGACDWQGCRRPARPSQPSPREPERGTVTGKEMAGTRSSRMRFQHERCGSSPCTWAGRGAREGGPRFEIALQKSPQRPRCCTCRSLFSVRNANASTGEFAASSRRIASDTMGSPMPRPPRARQAVARPERGYGSQSLLLPLL